MRFFPEGKKKKILSMLVLIVSLAGIIYFNFFVQTTVTPAVEPQALPETPIAPKERGGLLPYGAAIDLKILEQERFKELRAAPELSLSIEELGKKDPFAP